MDAIEHDIIRRVFDESFLNEKILTTLLHVYRDAAYERAAAHIEWLPAHNDPRDCAAAIRALATAPAAAQPE